jgi:Zn-finger nucleic acid-binding protein
MNCPVCKTQKLTARELNPSLTAQQCTQCRGQWISSFEFGRWFENNRAQHPQPALVPPALNAVTPETPSAKLCPECGHILARYKVGHALDFSLDRCGHCGGTWFDQNEWEILQNSDVRDKIHLIFSSAWQQQVRQESRTRHLQALFAEKVGEKDFREITRIKAWLNSHPKRGELSAFLNSDEF